MLTAHGHPFFLSHQKQECIVDGGNGEPLIVTGAGTEILVHGGFADGVFHKIVYIPEGKSEGFLDCPVIGPFFLCSAERGNVSTPTGDRKIRTGEAFGIKRG